MLVKAKWAVGCVAWAAWASASAAPSGPGGQAADAPRIQAKSWAALDARGRLVDGVDPHTPRPIASITKLAMAMAYLDAKPSLEGFEEIGIEDVDRLKGTSSRLPLGTRLTRAELLRLALASSENRAANALSRGFSGGTPGMVAAMNAKARAMGWRAARFVDATGLSPLNVASARDVAAMALAARRYPEVVSAAKVGAYTQAVGPAGGRLASLRYKNTNKPLREGALALDVSKTGYTDEAGKCLAWAMPASKGSYALGLLGAPSFPSRDAGALALSGWASGEAKVAGPARYTGKMFPAAARPKAESKARGRRG